MTTGIRIVFDHIPAIQAALRPRVSAAIKQSLDDGKAWIAQDMASKPPPSAPGETPAIVSAELVDSLTVENVNGLHGELTADGGHAVYLEFGTRKMSARPFMGPAASQIAGPLAVEVAAAILGGSVGGALNDAGAAVLSSGIA